MDEGLKMHALCMYVLLMANDNCFCRTPTLVCKQIQLTETGEQLRSIMDVNDEIIRGTH